ncbi:hypothetical protein Tco_1110568 [Tanacetum coccineum]|uniref:Uncharacterized protein n=1 Tax=Tanacetum coccineum TaxID=301880 RepID=A0ABQ5IKM3_9ASTR
MESVKKSIGERAQHKIEYERRVNERQIQTTEEKTDTSNAIGTLNARSISDRIYNESQWLEVDQNAEQCYDTCPLPAKLIDDKTIELLNQLLESENKKEGQQDQFLNVRSNEAKVKTDIDVTETINIELEHSVAKLLAENEQLHKEKEHLKQTYKDLFDSIKKTRVLSEVQYNRSILTRKDSEFGCERRKISPEKQGFKEF